MGRYAIVNEFGKVINVIEWDGISNWNPPENHDLVESDICDREDVYLKDHECFHKKSCGGVFHKNFTCEKMIKGEKCPKGLKIKEKLNLDKVLDLVEP